ncbi:MAG: CPBP family intramembrane metalloprotease [Psychrilyobacter sp.]|nr:CPBP family intramembrane metalloprotease [Psychrilyobacter sp.]
MNFKKSILVTFIYIVLMAIGMFFMHFVRGGTYGPSMMGTLVWVEIISSIFIIYFIYKYSNWKEIGFGKIKKKQVLWLLPCYVGILFSIYLLFSSAIHVGVAKEQWTNILLIFITVIFVGFSEEVVFRGILLRGAMKKFNYIPALLISAFGFALLHTVNVLGGQSISVTIQQFIMTFIFALFFIPLALKINNLVPLIIFHILWDFLFLSSAAFDITIIHAGLLQIYILLIIVILLPITIIQFRKKLK